MISSVLSISIMAVIVAASLLPMSFAQERSTVLYMDPLQSSTNAGDTIVFSGYLTTADGYAIQSATIHIKDDVSFGSDETLGTVATDANGEFYGTWEAQTRGGGGAYDFYAVFEGSDSFDRARSPTYSVTVLSSAGTTQAQVYYSTEIILDTLPPSAYTDQTIVFTGQLTSNGRGIAGATVKIMEDDPLIPDQLLAWGYTSQDGGFVIPWDVVGGHFESDFDIYATFDGDDTHEYARSYNQVISVLRYGGSISLDPINLRALVGERVEFSGTLRLDGANPEGAVVYIKDEDPLSGDDLLAVAYVDRNGRFSTYWFADYADFDDTVDIYAVFEGNENLARLTTCDAEPTMPAGGTCFDTIPLTIYGTVSTPTPPDGVVTGDGYMELYYSMNLPSNPKVAVFPSPDSYDEVRGHIIPVQEGILMWASGLESRHGGNWNVDFEVVIPGNRLESKPDVAVMLVTPERQEQCDRDTLGWARVPPSSPTDTVQTYVCSSSPSRAYSNADVAATAAHEFIHAVGLGHAFNVDGDLMCSVEERGPTCPFRVTSSGIPSILNLDAVAAIYGTDGFRNPNSQFAYGHKFYADGGTGATAEAGSVSATPDPTISGTGTMSFQTFRTQEFSIRHPSDWYVYGYATDLGSNPGSWESAASLVEFYDGADGWYSGLKVTFYEEDSNAVSNSGEAYLDILEYRLFQECLLSSYEYNGFECSNHFIADSQALGNAGGEIYWVAETRTDRYPSGESFDTTRSLVSIPVGRNSWTVDSITVSGVFSQYSDIISEMLASFELTGITPNIRRDGIAPVITAPPSMVVDAESRTGTSVHYRVDAVDGVDGTLVPHCIPSPGSFFPIGDTTVVCSATDQSGNFASESFTVTVRAATVPETKTTAPLLERAPVSNPAVVDNFGNPLSPVPVGQQVQITADLTSGQGRNQDFAYIVQIQDEDGVTTHLSWITGSLGAGKTFRPAQSWMPDTAGTYTVTIFVWESFANPVALSPHHSMTVDVRRN